MRHSLPQSHQFYVTAPQPCPYLAGKIERKLFTALQGDGAARLNDVLSHQGFRRSQNVLYRPSCAGCSSCLSARIVVGDFRPSRNQRRIIARNAPLERSSSSPWATEAQFALFRRYLDARHATGGMADMDSHEFSAMIEETPVRSRVVEYHARGARGRDLVAVCLTDVLSDGVSMVYSFFDPDRAADSLGAFIILDHIAIAREAGLPYVYLGYWVPGSPKMDYKQRYRPLEIFVDGRWTELGVADLTRIGRGGGDRVAIGEQVSAIELPATK
ncbi:arginyltransferase [Amaricoccus sp.]|uniref:arginyltransferase n=1 Tax=Amaricoccus sp. TaxID=1872485 RepID=UPI001B67937D|nr:arginyltransferase [Amaricoccus sp.]MBP7001575.1 arginyltransferase [Amaricoccus sp.]